MAADGDPSPASSASFHRAAIASLQSRPPGYEPQDRTVVAARPRQEQTQIAPAPQLPPYHSGGIITAAQVRASSYVPLPIARPRSEPGRPSAAASGLKALAFVVLGGLLASGLLLALSPDTFKGLWAGPDEPKPAEQKRGDTKGEAGTPEGDEAGEAGNAEQGDAKAIDAKAGDAKAVPDAIDDGADDGTAVDPTAGGEPPVVEPRPAVHLTAETLVTQAELALEEKHWREPAELSMALSLANLALVDPGHEALRRLRRAAEGQLLPHGQKAYERKRWSEASEAFRDLVAVWPDHEAARGHLLEALHEEGRVLSKLKDPARTLAIADEILTMEPTDFPALMLRADSLYALGRWEDAKQSYGRAKRENRRSKAAQTGYKRASAKARTNK
jgi:hypothetical protein